MEFFNRAKTVRLKGHLDKYLTADDDEQTVRQSRNGASKKARWLVELADDNPHVIRLKSCNSRYLTASDEPFLLGMTGKKVVQTENYNHKRDASIEWEPIKEGHRVKLRTRGGKFLRANGGTPPWRNSITHDLPHRTATQDWVLWEVDVVDVSVFDDGDLLSEASSFTSSSVRDDDVSSTPRSGRTTSYNASFSSVQGDDCSGANTPVHEGYKGERRMTSFASEVLRRSSVAASEKRWPSIKSDRSAHNSGRQDGMEFFNKAKAVRLQSHLGKYLVADEDEQTVRQSRNGASHKARWTVESVDGKRDRIRLKSCHGLYLTASDEPFLLGMTGKKVLQTPSTGKITDVSVEWVPVKEGLNVRLMTCEGKFLRANGGAPPWRNSVTHDVPHRTATQSWVLWGVEVVDISVTGLDSDSDSGGLSPASSFASLADDYSGSPDVGSPMVQCSDRHENISSMKQVSGMDFFRRAKSVRLKSHHNKYLTADSDEETVVQDRAGSSISARWTVEIVPDVPNVIRLRSRHGKYLTAADEEFLLGVTGRKVVQSLPRKLDSSVEWEPIRDGMQVKLKTRYGNFLRANGGLPPWRNSITHDIPHRHHDWILWEVDVVEVRDESPLPKKKEVLRSDSLEEEEEEDLDLRSGSFHLRMPSVSSGSVEDSPRKSEGRLIYYYVADDEGEVNDAIEEACFQFKGLGLEELTQRLEEETGLEDIIVCSRNIVNEKLYPLRLALPPNNATMHVVVVPPTSKAANDFLPPAPTST